MDMRHYRQRFLDGRSSEARRLKRVIDGLVSDLGGKENLTGAQRLILEGLREKIATVQAIGAHIDRQTALIGQDGELIPSLRRSYIAYSNSVSRDVALLHGLRGVRKKKGPDLAAYLAGKKVNGE